MAKSSRNCRTLSLVRLMGKKWTIPIIEVLYPKRNKVSFNNMQVRLGRNITARNLSKSLKELSYAGMVKRAERNERGVLHTEYSLTNEGVELREFIQKAKRLGISVYGTDASCLNRRCVDCAAMKI